MIPPISHPCWVKLVSGQKKIQSTNWSFNMMVANNARRHKQDSSAGNVMKLITESHQFVAKYETMLQPEINELIH